MNELGVSVPWNGTSEWAGHWNRSPRAWGICVKGLIRDIDPDTYTKPKLSASTTEAKEAKKARREETVRRKAVQEEMSLIAMRVFENLLARESAENTIDGSSQFERASCDVPVDSD